MEELKPILIAEDDSDDRYLINRAFRDVMLPGQLKFVDSGKELFKYLDLVLTDSQLPGLIVLDLNMPMMDGIETLVALKASSRYKHIPVVIFTTSINPLEEQRSRALGATDFIIKPSSYDEVKHAAKLFHSYFGTRAD